MRAVVAELLVVEHDDRVAVDGVAVGGLQRLRDIDAAHSATKS
jgi:hypothetical protein